MQVTLYLRGTLDPTNRTFSASASGPGWQEVTVEGTTVSSGGVSTPSFTFGTFPTQNTETDFYLVAGKSTRKSVTYSAYGQPLWTESEAYTSSGWIRTQLLETYFGSFGAEMFPTQTDLFHGVGNPLRILETVDWDGGLLTARVDAEGKRTEVGYDAGGRKILEVLKSKSGQPQAGEQFTAYILDGAGRVTQRRGQASASVDAGDLVESFAYDTAGRMTSSSQGESGAGTLLFTTSYEYRYSSDLRKTRKVLPGGADRIEYTNLDGTMASVTGSAQVPQLFTYTIEAGGIACVQTAIAPGVGWQESRSDWLGRTFRQTYPTTASTYRETLQYNAAGQLVARLTQDSGGTNVLSPYRFVYDSMGNVLREGLDLNEDGILTHNAASNDRITEYSLDFVNADGAWWYQKDTLVYYDSASTSTARINRARVRLTGLSGTLASESVQIDANNNKLSTTTSVAASTATMTTESTVPGSSTTVRSITQNGFVKETRSKEGVVSTYTYDVYGRETKVQGRSSVFLEKTYYPGHLLVKNLRNLFMNPDTISAEWQEFVYDNAARVAEHKVNDNGTWKSAYYSYTSRGDLHRQWGPRVSPLQYTYDSYGWRTEQTVYQDASGFGTDTWPTSLPDPYITVWAYQAASGLLTSKLDPKSKSVSFTYDTLNRLSTRIWAREAVTTYYYRSASGQRTGEFDHKDYTAEPGGMISTASVSAVYTRDGNISQITDAFGQRDFVYRTTDRQLQSELLPTTFGLDGSSNRRMLTYKYDGSITGRYRGYQLGFAGDDRTLSVLYDFDSSTGRMSTLNGAWRFGLFDTQQSSSAAYTYETGSNHVKTVTQGNFVKTNNWQSWREVTDSLVYTWSGSKRAEVSHDYDWLERRVGETVKGTLAVDLNYTHGFRDWRTFSWRTEAIGLDREYLTVSGTPSGTYDSNLLRDWTYGGQSNRTQETRTVGTSTYATNAANQYTSISSWGADAFIYDDDGNLTQDNLWNYYYDGENRLDWMVKRDNTQNVQFAYDYMNRRSQKVVRSGNTLGGTVLKNRKFVYEGWKLLAEIDGPMPAATVIQSYVWGIDKSGSIHGAGGVGGLLQVNDPTGRFLAISDESGNIRGLVDPTSGTLASRFDYTSFGELIVGTGGIAATMPFRFATKYVDSETGLADYNHRFYSARLGRFINRDPIGEMGGANLYAYAGNDPVNGFDYLGLTPIVIQGQDLQNLLSGYGSLGDFINALGSGQLNHVFGDLPISSYEIRILFDSMGVYSPWPDYDDYWIGLPDVGGQVSQRPPGEPPYYTGNSSAPNNAATAAAGGSHTGVGATSTIVLNSSATVVLPDGQVRILDRAAAASGQGARQFHLDVNGSHLNADVGPLRGLNHRPVSPSTLVYGSEAFLKSASRITLVGGLAVDAVMVNTAAPNQLGAAYGGVAGGWGGAAAGAGIGLAVGGPVWAIIGGFVGGWGGSVIGDRIQNGPRRGPGGG